METNPYNKVEALKIGYKVKDILNDTDSKLKIHSIFEHAINLKDHSDWIITLLPENYSAGPQTVILTQEDFAEFKSLGFKVMDICDFRNLINTENAITFTGRTIDESTLKGITRIHRNIGYFESILFQRGNKGGLLGESSIYSKYAAPIIAEIKDSFAQGKYEQAADNILELIGLGPGLTPSGDDFILGILTTFKFCLVTQDIVCDLTKKIINEARTRTNIISYNMLRQGAMGGFPEWVEDMAFSIICGNSEDIDMAFSKILRIGSSSGSDISAGMLFGLKLIARRLWDDF